RRRTHEVAGNWKLVMDAFNEGYHIQRLHADTIAPFFVEAGSVDDMLGPHQRSALGRVDPAGDAPEDDLDAMCRGMTFAYQLFPNANLIASPDYLNLLVCQPVSHAHTRVEDFMLIPAPPADDRARGHWARSFELIDGGVFAAEDFHAVALQQQGLASGAIAHVELGGLESKLRAFADRVDAFVGDAAVPDPGARA
ncbi:MAG TPA: SRPBCC family protein, partial [Burkholderiaceae bacterium]|nr:SRPBCC family protein [Burkholderiaceae bacterium]